MIIGIDGNEANNKERVGVHQYAHEILKAIHRLIGDENKDVQVKVYLKSAPLPDMPNENSYWKYVVLGDSKFWVLTKLMLRLLTKKECDIFFSPNHYLPFMTRTPKVCTIHDLGYLEFSGQFKKYDFWQLKYWTAISLNISKYIISVSESTKKDIVRQYNINPKKVNVVEHGYDKSRFHMGITINDVRQAKNKYKIDSDYILYLGTLKPSKNIEGIISAFIKLKNDREISGDIKLIIGGKKGWLFEPIYEKIRENV